MAMDITLVMPTMDTMDTHMPIMDMPTTARERLMLMLSMDTMVTDITLVMPTTDMDTMDTHMLTMDMPTMARDLLMLRPMLMLTTDTHMPMVTDMPTADTTDTHTLTDGESKMLTKS